MVSFSIRKNLSFVKTPADFGRDRHNLVVSGRVKGHPESKAGLLQLDQRAVEFDVRKDNGSARAIRSHTLPT
ncbi:MAG: hypothetical protein ABWY57_01910 [Mycetocola sp.]